MMVVGTYGPAEPATWEYPGSPAEIDISRYEIGGVDVSNLVEAANWYEEIDSQIRKAFGEPAIL
ncbi:hypothetical protein BLX24_03935 [Arsenicibacter rosenii]|uniref:Uncharacterized protein n=1 Tax=Arsenicibacter rosenii TaxID=1750698 RepID=A0A1S2VR28_9BACT|nr:hypothetical protein BLX24_03935 [Arsenicibacter rosenii]